MTVTVPVTVLDFVSGAEWEAWLEAQHGSASDAWLRIAKRRSRRPGLRIEDALDGALCFGWIDGQRRSNDAESFLQRYSPRRPASPWSRINVLKFEALAAAGRVRPAGHAAAAAARADGRWDAAYASQRDAETPPELIAALAARPDAERAFAELGRTERYALILPLLRARTPERRAELLARAVDALAAGAPVPGASVSVGAASVGAEPVGAAE
ncbi:YdeI/OmpD-associated family protein [Leucobacter sp. HNU]|uniref:YdeI/OmpD-associated family protein n=1 Tax=Leucobacter sp. HNU TaxID=3236805 RepID=UPI003A8095EC